MMSSYVTFLILPCTSVTHQSVTVLFATTPIVAITWLRADGNRAVCSKLWFQLPNTILPSNLMWHVCHGYDNILL